MTTVDQVIASVESELGRPYVYGAEGPSDFDCSGLMQYAFGKVGISLPRTADEQYRATKRVSSPSPGDLVFYLDGTGKATHVALYIGNGQMVEAPDVGLDVRIHNVYELAGHTRTYGRVSGLSAGVVAAATTVTTAVSTATTSLTSALGLDSLFTDIEEILLEGLFAILGGALIFIGTRKLAGNRKSKGDD